LAFLFEKSIALIHVTGRRDDPEGAIKVHGLLPGYLFNEA